MKSRPSFEDWMTVMWPILRASANRMSKWVWATTKRLTRRCGELLLISMTTSLDNRSHVKQFAIGLALKLVKILRERCLIRLITNNYQLHYRRCDSVLRKRIAASSCYPTLFKTHASRARAEEWDNNCCLMCEFYLFVSWFYLVTRKAHKIVRLRPPMCWTYFCSRQK